MSEALLASTLTRGSPAPEESPTMPVIAVWPNAVAGASRHRRTRGAFTPHDDSKPIYAFYTGSLYLGWTGRNTSPRRLWLSLQESVGRLQSRTPVESALFSALYEDLHRLARRELARNGSAMSLGVTTLLHEAYLDLAERTGPEFPDRPRFMGYAARVMRGLIIDHVRAGHAQKRGGQFEITSARTDIVENIATARELTEVSDALDELAKT